VEGVGLPYVTDQFLATLGSLIDQVPFGLAVFDFQLRFTAVSRGFESMHECRRDELVGQHLLDVMPRALGRSAATRVNRVLESGDAELNVETWGIVADPNAERCFLSSYYRIDLPTGEPFAVVMLVVDVTTTRKSEISARTAAIRLGLLQEVTAALSDTLNLGDVSQTIITSAANAVDASAAVLLVVRPKDGTVKTIATMGILETDLERVQGEYSLDARTPATDALRVGQPIYWTSTKDRMEQYPDLAPAQDDFRSWAFVPLITHDTPRGVACFAWLNNRPFTDDDRLLLVDVGTQCAVALHRVNEVGEAQQRSLAEVEERRDREAFLRRASEIVASGEDFAETLQLLAGVGVPALGDLCLVDVMSWDGEVKRMAARHADPRRQRLADRLLAEFSPDPQGPHPSIEALRNGRVSWSPDMSDDYLRSTTRSEDHYRLVKELGFTSFMALPLFGENRILGSLTLVSAGSGRRFSTEDVDLAAEFASCVAQVVTTAHRTDAARHAAQTLQASLLPEEVPQFPGLEISVRYLPATVDNDVGGDFYDVVVHQSGSAGVWIGDVSGHDMEAAAAMGRLRSAARVLVGQARTPARLIEMLRDGWPFLNIDRMATVLFAEVDPETGHVIMASAGHPPPVLVEGGTARFMEVDPSSPLGAPATPATDWTSTLAPGAVLFLFTDGLIEDRHRGFDEGMAKLLSVLSGADDPNEICDRVLEAFVLNEVREDDVAIVALRRLETE
jgi:serine phosphatase RsbU (regulator of sigma subunit)